jgi:hypothetical protein
LPKNKLLGDYPTEAFEGDVRSGMFSRQWGQPPLQCAVAANADEKKDDEWHGGTSLSWTALGASVVSWMHGVYAIAVPNLYESDPGRKATTNP